MGGIFAYILHKGGVVDDTATELIAAAKAFDNAASPTAVAVGTGAGLDAVCTALCSSYAEVWKIANDALAYPNAELIRKALLEVLPQDAILLLPHEHFGVDLAPGLSIKMNSPYVSDATGIEGVAGTTLRATRQEFGGQVSAHVQCDISNGAVISVRAGAFKSVEGLAANGTIVDKSSAVGALSAGRRYLETIAAETGDVDITKQSVLVSVGRGIQEADNVGIAQALADALGGAVSCSRPVVDAKWLDKSRQVGTSGQTVKPKVYIACGISGSFQHMAGIKGNPFIVAINKNPKAPIFQLADVGIVDDVLEFLPALIQKVRES